MESLHEQGPMGGCTDLHARPLAISTAMECPFLRQAR